MNINETLIYYSKQLEKINNDYKLSYIEVQTIIMHTLNISKTKLISEGLRDLKEEGIIKIESLTVLIFMLIVMCLYQDQKLKSLLI